MTLTRRRFLTISAAAVACPGAAVAESWQGRAFGADVSLTIRGVRMKTRPILQEARHLIRKIEGQFSLYDPTSALSRLNAHGLLREPSAHFMAVMWASDAAHRLTDGLFDPTVQPLWAAYAENRKPREHIDRIGWNRVRFDASQITLDQHQALTFNGIAQGYATDKVTELLTAHGLTDVLVNIGEHRSTGGPWRIGLQDPTHGALGARSLTTGAIATSSPQATPLGQGGHILHGSAHPHWSTVSVEAASATLADSLSTALVLAPYEQIKAVKDAAEVTRITLVDFAGDLTTL